MSMLTDWVDWAFHHRRPDFHRQVATNRRYETFLACFRSEQMSASQLRAHMEEDAALKAYVEAEIATSDPARAFEDSRVLVHH
jgi:hypothetical protein